MTRELIYQRIDEIYGKVDLRKPVRVWNRYGNLENYFGEYLSEELVESFLRDCKKDYILENLQTHDWKKLVVKIRDMFPKIQFIADKLHSEDKAVWFFMRISSFGEIPINLAMQDIEEKQEEIEKIAAFFGYEVTLQPLRSRISFEPRYTESAKDFIYDNCHGIVYHITSRRNAKKILKSGLRIRTGDLELTTRTNPPQENYRNFPKRIYVTAFDPEVTVDIREELEDIANTVGEGDNLVAIRIRIPERSDIPFYQDTAMYGDNSFYTYTNIPAEYIDYIINL